MRFQQVIALVRVSRAMIWTTSCLRTLGLFRQWERTDYVSTAILTFEETWAIQASGMGDNTCSGLPNQSLSVSRKMTVYDVAPEHHGGDSTQTGHDRPCYLQHP
mgnify:CR=1 FL=1